MPDTISPSARLVVFSFEIEMGDKEKEAVHAYIISKTHTNAYANKCIYKTQQNNKVRGVGTTNPYIKYFSFAGLAPDPRPGPFVC